MTANTEQAVGQRIGRAIARDVITEGMPREWTGLDAQDAEQIPAGLDREQVERAARAAYAEAMAAAERPAR
jgi:hypothetical protein